VRPGTPKNILNMKVKGMCKRETNINIGRVDDHGKKSRGSCGKTEADSETWLSYDPTKVEMFYKDV
jgi:hypothetical protein